LPVNSSFSQSTWGLQYGAPCFSGGFCENSCGLRKGKERLIAALQLNGDGGDIVMLLKTRVFPAGGVIPLQTVYIGRMQKLLPVPRAERCSVYPRSFFDSNRSSFSRLQGQIQACYAELSSEYLKSLFMADSRKKEVSR